MKILTDAQRLYAGFVQLPVNDIRRVTNQELMGLLRDFIARSWGRTPESVQEQYERAYDVSTSV